METKPFKSTTEHSQKEQITAQCITVGHEGDHEGLVEGSQTAPAQCTGHTDEQTEGPVEEGSPLELIKSTSHQTEDASEVPAEGTSERLTDGVEETNAENKTSNTSPEGMSKNQLRKLKRKQEWEMTKDQRIQERREKRIERRRRKPAAGSEVIPRKRRRKMTDPDASDVRVVVDCGFDDLMTSPDVTKLSKQIQRSYASNRTSDKPFQFYICNFGSKTKSRFNTALAEHPSWDVNFREQGLNELFGKDSIVYLTSESPNVLTTLDSGKVYVIGGLVDHNHHKGICYERAVSQGWDHAQLPINEFMKIRARKVLTVNHVFEILVAYMETNDWKAAFDRVIPQRKFHTMSRKERRKKEHQEKEAAERDGKFDTVSLSDGEETVMHDGSKTQEEEHDGSTLQEAAEHDGSITQEVEEHDGITLQEAAEHDGSETIEGNDNADNRDPKEETDTALKESVG